MLIHRISRLTGAAHVREIPITEDQLAEWKRGRMIQNIAPELSADDREYLISGSTPEEWSAAFG